MMFGQSGGGGGGVGPWQVGGQQLGGQNLNAESLAKTLVNVAQNLLSSQQANSHASSGYGARETPSPWANVSGGPNQRQGLQSSPMSSHSTSHRSSNPKPLMSMGLLGPAPAGNFGPMREPSFVIGDQPNLDQSWGSYNDSSFETGFGIGEDSYTKKVQSRGSFDTDKSRKNYRPKIKEDGCPPKYFVEDYEHLSKRYLRCSLCNKEMWNSLSFVNHLKGNAHNSAVEDLAKNEASKVGEVRKMIHQMLSKDVSKARPGDKAGGKCNMCDVKVKGEMGAHRRTDYHQKLKAFIHPHCSICDADFEDRSEWYYHKYSGEHLNNLKVKNREINYDPMSGVELDKLLKDLQKRSGFRRDSLNNSKSSKNVSKNDMFKEMKAAINKTKKVDDDIIIMDEEDTNPEKQVADAVKDLGVLGADYIKPVNGMFCKLCKKFFGAGAAAITEHCNTKVHVDTYNTNVKNGAKKRSLASEFFSPKKMK